MLTDPSVPASQKQIAEIIGLSATDFPDTSGYPHQLYVREARRMKSSYVLTQKDMQGETDPANAVGLASYGVDDWPYATYPFNGKVALNGGYFSELYLTPKNQGIYKIPYSSIIPRATECDNLLVPVCCSASHIAMTSLRMEPTWITLGESAGVAAALALKQQVAIQKIHTAKLQSRLLELGIKLAPPVEKEPKSVSG